MEEVTVVTMFTPVVLERAGQQSHVGVMFRCPHTFGYDVVEMVRVFPVTDHTSQNDLNQACFHLQISA